MTVETFMQCPACQRPLRRFNAGPVTLDGCDGGCGGIWFDYRELGKATRAQPDLNAKVADIFHDPDVAVDDYAVRSCPRCAGTTLDKKLYSLGSGVIMDRCPKCRGVWLDNGELEKIQAALHPRSFAQHIHLDVIQQIHTLQFGAHA
jgi:Zn-finger nucleic acid-binding protein